MCVVIWYLFKAIVTNKFPKCKSEVVNSSKRNKKKEALDSLNSR